MPLTPELLSAGGRKGSHRPGTPERAEAEAEIQRLRDDGIIAALRAARPRLTDTQLAEVNRIILGTP